MQGEGALFALGQHETLQAISRGLLPGEKWFAFLEDIFIVAAPERLAILGGDGLVGPRTDPNQPREDANVEPSAMRDKVSAFWASWADALPTIRERHPFLLINFAWPFNAAIGVSTTPLLLIFGSNLSRAGSIVPNGETSPGICDQGRLQLTTPCPGSARGGNEVWQRTSMKHSTQCGRDCTPTSRRSSVPKVARWQAYHSAPSHCPVRLGSNSRSSVCCSGALCPCPRQVAGVAVHSIREATTGSLSARAQLAIDTTMVSLVRMDGSARGQCATNDGLLACAAARAFALSLLERCCFPGCNGPRPSSAEVVWAHRDEA